MYRKFITPFVSPVFFMGLLCATVALAPLTGHAAITPAATPTNYGINGTINTTQGWAFTLSQATTVQALGFFDYGTVSDGSYGTIPDGLALSHKVTLYTSAGATLAQATVPSGTAATLVGDFRYVSITALTLPAGNYVIGATYTDLGGQGDPDDIAITNTFNTVAGLTITDGRFAFSPDTFPNVGNTEERFGPNLLVGTVPEPSTFITLGVAGLILACRYKRANSCAAV